MAPGVDTAPAADTATPAAESNLVDAKGRTCYTVIGYPRCKWFERAQVIARTLENERPLKYKVAVNTVERTRYGLVLFDLQRVHNIRWRTSPVVLEGCGCEKKLVGGFDDFRAIVAKQIGGSI